MISNIGNAEPYEWGRGKCEFSEVGRAVYRTVPLVYFERLLWPWTIRAPWTTSSTN
jgi:hypothetical protein